MHQFQWILEETVLAIHSEQLAEHGGREGIRDLGLLQSALDAPKKTAHYENVSIAKLAAIYAFRLCNNHAFIDGNKRTAYITSRLFLLLNGYDIKASEKDKTLTFMKLANGLLTESALIEWFEKHC